MVLPELEFLHILDGHNAFTGRDEGRQHVMSMLMVLVTSSRCSGWAVPEQVP
jgi:hypothetical protein